MKIEGNRENCGECTFKRPFEGQRPYCARILTPIAEITWCDTGPLIKIEDIKKMEIKDIMHLINPQVKLAPIIPFPNPMFPRR